ncbi:hypothetical protein D3C75_870820 [compost metagenome]
MPPQQHLTLGKPQQNQPLEPGTTPATGLSKPSHRRSALEHTHPPPDSALHRTGLARLQAERAAHGAKYPAAAGRHFGLCHRPRAHLPGPACGRRHAAGFHCPAVPRFAGVDGQQRPDRSLAGDKLGGLVRWPALHLPPAPRRAIHRRHTVQCRSGQGQPRPHGQPQDPIQYRRWLHPPVPRHQGARHLHGRSHSGDALCGFPRSVGPGLSRHPVAHRIATQP